MPTKSIQTLKGRVIRCILFDLGDTLWRRRDMAVWLQLENTSNRRAGALLRSRMPADRFADLDDALLGQRVRDILDTNTRSLIRQDPGLEPDCGFVIAQALPQFGLDRVDLVLGTAIFEALRVRIPESRPLYDDAIPTLAELQRRSFLLGVVTNRLWGGKIFQEDLHTLGLLNYFDPANIAISADLGVRKPNAAIFMHTLNALDVPPAQAVMVGDSLRSDVIGAKMLDIFAIWKPKPRIRAEMKAHLVAPGASSGAYQDPPPQKAGPVDLPPGMHITDDDYILAYAQNRDNKYRWDPLDNNEIRPDLTIEHLSDLLDVFMKVGEQ